jgi:hypothetical protein
MYRSTIVVCLSALVCLAGASLADIPKLINYQGMLTESDGSTPVADGTYDITFKIYNASSGGDKRWEETQTDVAVTSGLFNVILGGATVGGIDLDFSEEYWLDVTVEGETMSERLRFTSVGYAYRARIADSATVAVSAPTGGGWTDDGTVVRLETSTDKVMIGTGSPAEELHVNGDIRLSSTGDITFVDDNTKIYETGDDLVITADDDVFLWPDDNIYIGADGGPNWIQFDPGGQKLGIGTTAPLARTHLRGSSLSLPSEAVHYDEFILEDADAILGLYSGTSGPAGSAITFGEIAGGALAEKWAIIRETAGGGKGLRITYGTDKDQFVNPTIMYLDSLGNVGVGTKITHSTLRVNGSLAMKIKNETDGYSVEDSDCVLVVDTPGDVSTNIYLPSAVGIAGRVYTIKYVGGWWAWVYPSDGEKIDDSFARRYLPPWEYVTIISDGSNWLIIGQSP